MKVIKMIWVLGLLIMILAVASATVEDIGSQHALETGGTWPTSIGPPLTVAPTVTCPAISDCLKVTVSWTGPASESDRHYTTPGKTLEFVVTVKNDGISEADAELSVNPENCHPDWFSWTSKNLQIPAGLSRSEPLQVRPDMSAIAGDYGFIVEASSQCNNPGSDKGSFKIQDYDYASETAVSGTGQFQINKDIRSMDSGIKSNKDIFFSGSVDALVKNEYLVERAKGRNPNFEEQDAVDNYVALSPGDALFGTESFKSSMVFGGIGAKVLESYNVKQMEFKKQDFNLYQTGSLKKMAEFRTADNFTGFYMIDAKQILPGQKSLKEHEEYLGSFEINRRILFKDRPRLSNPCFSDACDKFWKNINSFTNSN